MLRIVLGLSVATVLVSGGPALAQKAKGPSCTYETCLAACTQMGGGSRQGGCSGYCEKTIRERKASGVCK